MASKIFIGSDYLVLFDKVKDLDGNYVNNGTCTYALSNKQTENIVDSGNVPYVDASNGKYKTIINSTITQNLILKDYYLLTVTFTKSGFDSVRQLELQADYAS